MIPRWAEHPAFAPYRRWLAGVDDVPPALERLNAFAREAGLALPSGRPLAFVAPDRRLAALDYERAVAATGTLPTRPGSWHDAFNALAWLAFPHAKAALNALHRRHGAHATGNRRDRARDAATLLDESGLVVACADPDLAALVRDHAWREAFVGRAASVARAGVAVVGHGLLDKLRHPYRAITARALMLDAALAPKAIDVAVARVVSGAAFGPASLTPLPVAALPGWDVHGDGDARFDDASVFRPKVLGSRRATGPREGSR